MHNRQSAFQAGLPLLLSASVALALTLPANFCRAASPAVLWAVVAAVPSQASSGASAREASDKLLREARAAIKRGDYTRAESLINDAEKLGAQYNPLTDRWSDTPDIIRKLLAQERAKANAAKPG